MIDDASASPIREVKTKPKFLPFKCPNCNGYGSVSYGKVVCHVCNGLGVVVLNNETGEVVANEVKYRWLD